MRNTILLVPILSMLLACNDSGKHQDNGVLSWFRTPDRFGKVASSKFSYDIYRSIDVDSMINAHSDSLLFMNYWSGMTYDEFCYVSQFNKENGTVWEETMTNPDYVHTKKSRHLVTKLFFDDSTNLDFKIIYRPGEYNSDIGSDNFTRQFHMATPPEADYGLIQLISRELKKGEYETFHPKLLALIASDSMLWVPTFKFEHYFYRHGNYWIGGPGMISMKDRRHIWYHRRQLEFFIMSDASLKNHMISPTH